MGGNLSRALVSRGHDVTGYVLNPELGSNAGFKCKSVYELLNSSVGAEPYFDVTINLAARRKTSAQSFTENEVRKFTFEIPREFILRTAGPDTFVLNSSTYIQNHKGISGQTVDSYSASKEMLSRFLEIESTRNKFRTLDLFFFTLYGVGDRSNHLVPLLIDAAVKEKQILLSPGNQLMNLLFIDDAIHNILKCIDESVFIGYAKNYVWSDEYFSVRELVERIQNAIGKTIECAWGAREYAGHEMMEPWTIPMERMPGFQAPTKLETGIKKIWQSI